jgi:hypothetical protein
MPSQTLARGMALATIAVLFGVSALRLPIGQFSRPGAGLFPLIVSSLLLFLALVIIARSFLAASAALNVNLKNIAVVLLGLAGFAIFSRLVGMALGIVWLVFVTTLAGTSYSWQRNVKVSVGLIIIALMFEKFLGLNLRVV